MKYMDMVVIDWETALDSYQELGGGLFYCEGKQRIKYKTILEVYQNLIAMHEFLKQAKEITKTDFIGDDLLNPYTISSSVSYSTYSDVSNIEERIETLKKEEKSESDQRKKELKFCLAAIQLF